MDLGSSILSDMIVFSKYAQYIPEKKRRETWEEIVTRNKEMHQRKFPGLADDIEAAYKMVYEKKVLPSMRSLQFGGNAIEKNNIRTYNCAFLPVDSYIAVDEIFYLLLCGTGVGYSVRKKDIDKTPDLTVWSATYIHIIEDSIEGWAMAVRLLLQAYFVPGNSLPVFDYSAIRAKGVPLSSGGLAPGPEPLKKALDTIRELLEVAVVAGQTRLTSLQWHDIICHLSDAVLAGGIRRSAMIVLFDPDDMDMLTCKHWENLKDNYQRFRANNSVALHRDTTTKEQFLKIWKIAEDSKAGEPGIYWTNDHEFGTNPCCEIALRAFQFCNLCEINVSNVVDQEDFNARVRVAALIGTIQASYTHFPYIRSIWKETTEREALLGIGMTGIASGAVMSLDMEEAAQVAKEVNEDVAALIGINKAARVTTVKPSGTSSIVLGCSSGVHAWHDTHYIRRIRLLNNEPLGVYIMDNHPELWEISEDKPATEIVVSVPIRAPDNAITRNESPVDLLERTKRIANEWIRGGHREGSNYNNVSCTVSIKDDEWQLVGEWMWNNREYYAGLSCLPFSDAVYVQAPFETITEEQYNFLMVPMKTVDVTNIIEYKDNTFHEGEAACSAGSCEVNSI
jgi:ribonucleoside-triphosphate reductase